MGRTRIPARLPGPLADVLGAAVRVGTVRVGEVVGVFLRGSQAVGLEVAGAGGARYFLPWFAARFDTEGIRIESAFLLVDAIESYERHGARPVRSASALRALEVSLDGLVEAGAAGTRVVRASPQAIRPQS